VVALVAAAVWAVIVEVSHYELGIVATGIGLLVGVAMGRTASANRSLPTIAAVLALVGCLVGDFLADASEAARALETTMANVLEKSVQHPDLAAELFRIGFAPMDILFWALAAYAAFRQTQAGVAGAIARQQPVPAAGAPGFTYDPTADLSGEPPVPGAAIAPATAPATAPETASELASATASATAPEASAPSASVASVASVADPASPGAPTP
jgi:hypothetical protein